MSAPRVSVVVPSYNHGPYLAERLDSILGQTFEDLEVIVIDDASTDDSLTVVRRFEKDPRLRVIVNETNSGNPFVQWNRGVETARGEMAWIAESDDAARPELLEVLVGELDAHDGAGLAYCQSLKIDGDGKEIGVNTDWTDDLDREHWRRDHVVSGRDECRYMVVKNVIPNASAVVFRRDLYREVGGAPEHLRAAGDWMTWTRMMLRSQVVFCAEPLNRYRQHASSVTERSVLDGRWAEEGYLVLEEILAAVEVDEDAVERARDRLMFQWQSSGTSPRSLMTAADHRRIARIARRCDPDLTRRARRTFRPMSHFRGLAFLLRVVFMK